MCSSAVACVCMGPELPIDPTHEPPEREQKGGEREMTSDLSPDPSGLFSLEEGEQYVQEVRVLVVWLYHIAGGREEIDLQLHVHAHAPHGYTA